METAKALLEEMKQRPAGSYCPAYFRAKGYENGKRTSPSGKRADAIAALFAVPEPYIYRNDWIAGSLRPLFVEAGEDELRRAGEICAAYPERHFGTNADHFSPDYDTAVKIGVPGLLDRIAASEKEHAGEADRLEFLDSMRGTLEGLRTRLIRTAEKAAELVGADGYDDEKLLFIEANCRDLAERAPESFAEALQLIWMIHSCFSYEGRYAMALGRIDQVLMPFYLRDTEEGTLTEEFALELIENALAKICERAALFGGDDVVNVCIGGVKPDGSCAVNKLSRLVLRAVGDLNRPGPNLSARITPDTPDDFLDSCLKVIGTGLGYPALMNDEVNRAALSRYGYDEADVRNYSMVGCIENFITGCQPPWSDGRFDTPRFIGKVLHPDGADGPVGIDSMDAFMKRFEEELAVGADAYMRNFQSYNVVPDPASMTSPFLSCFCRDCIARGLDINMGGAKYPSVHGVCLMGVGTTCDALAALEKVVFLDGEATLEEVMRATEANFEGYGELRAKLLAAPKYGNNDPFVDKYAIWFVDYLTGVFDRYRTYDGGGIYSAMAANTSNIWAGKTIGATPDGRLAGEPLSDAASPTYGRDTGGVTSTILSVSKPDYGKVACGTVLNQKFFPDVFEDGKRDKLLALIRAYFARGGQEIQINATSERVLREAMEKPEEYASLVVRVSGFSALYTTLGRDVQEDILKRTQQSV